MKTYQVSVNGEQFTVTVEEVTGAAPASAQRTTMPSAPPSSPPPAPPKPAPQSTPSPAPAPSPGPPPAADDSSGTNIQAPMPGKILNVHVKPGDTVKNGAVLVVLEAMKMENDIMAPQDGVVKAVHVAVGDSVNGGDVLLTIGS